MTRNVTINLIEDATPVTDAVVTLADSTGTFGIRRADTNAIVVASGTSVPYVSNGDYTYAFTGAIAGVAYEATVRVAWADGSIDYFDRPLAAEDADGGYYASVADLESFQGVANLTIYSNTQGQKTRDDARLTAALGRADREIDAALRSRGFVAPLARSDSSFGLLTDVAVRLALYWLFSPRANREEGDEASGDVIRANTWRKRARDELNALTANGMGGATRISAAPIYPVATGCP